MTAGVCTTMPLLLLLLLLLRVSAAVLSVCPATPGRSSCGQGWLIAFGSRLMLLLLLMLPLPLWALQLPPSSLLLLLLPVGLQMDRAWRWRRQIREMMSSLLVFPPPRSGSAMPAKAASWEASGGHCSMETAPRSHASFCREARVCTSPRATAPPPFPPLPVPSKLAPTAATVGGSFSNSPFTAHRLAKDPDGCCCCCC